MHLITNYLAYQQTLINKYLSIMLKNQAKKMLKIQLIIFLKLVQRTRIKLVQNKQLKLDFFLNEFSNFLHQNEIPLGSSSTFSFLRYSFLSISFCYFNKSCIICSKVCKVLTYVIRRNTNIFYQHIM